MLSSLIGIIASSGGVAVSSSYESIATTTVGAGGAASVTFSSIPSTYQHLQIRVMNLMTSNAAAPIITLGTGGTLDTTTTNYDAHYLAGNGASASAGYINDRPQFAWVTGNSNSSNPEVSVIDLLDYANTNKFTTLRGLAGVDNNGSGEVSLTSGLWRNTAAVNIIGFTCNSGNFAQNSSFALYGIKG
jgi:hypothetical protein